MKDIRDIIDIIIDIIKKEMIRDIIMIIDIILERIYISMLYNNYKNIGAILIQHIYSLYTMMQLLMN
jgi:hypothetical protein